MFRTVYFLLLLFPLIALSQRPDVSRGVSGYVSGVLLDSLTRIPLEYVAVGVIDQSNGQVVNGGLSDEKGGFRISDIPFGEYMIQINYIGYSIREIRQIRLTTQRPHSDLGRILLTPESQLLKEIQIVGEAALIEAKPDKIVYNAERDITSRGGDAADVLRKVPLLTVDFDGNVSMRGSENVTVLINGRPSAIFNSNLADALKMMPSDQIHSVEVITSPSARFDGEGTAGIINIITKKKNLEGTAGSIDLTGGTRSNRGNLNLNHGKGRLGINLSGGGHYSWPQEGSTTFRREDFGSTLPSLLTQDGTSKASRLGFRTQAGIEYNFNPYNSISSSVSYRGFRSGYDNQVLSAFMEENELIDAYTRRTDGVSSRSGLDWEMSYKKLFPRKNQEWAVAFELEKDINRSESDYDQSYNFPADQPSTLENNLNKGDNLEFTIQTDYVHPIGEKIKLETGAKARLQSIISDFDFSLFNPDLNTWVINPERTDVFHYDQNVYAGYLSSSMVLGEKMNLIAGARVEVTDLGGSFDQFDSPFSNTYSNLLPSLTLSRKVGEFNSVKISYNQRIQRPNRRHINPFIEYNDNRDISYGNPLLGPEIVHQVEVGSNIFLKGNMLNISIFGRRTKDLIENLLRINHEGISEFTFANFGVQSALGLNVFGSLNLGDKLSLRGGFDVNVWEVEGRFEGEDLSNTGYAYNGRMNITWTVNETLRMEGFTFFRSPNFTVQGKTPSWSMLSFGIKKDLLNRRLTLGLNITEPFIENRIFVRELSGTGFYQYSRSVRPVRSFGLNLGYRFGKLDFRERSGRKRVNNNDLKDEDQGGENQF